MLTVVLVWLATGLFYQNPNAWASTFNNSVFSHTYTQIYSSPSPFGQPNINWLYNNTNSRAYPDGVCVAPTSSGNQLQFRYQTGTTSQNLGDISGGQLYGAKIAPGDYGNGIDVASQHKIFYAQGRWWVFYINGTGGNAHKIIFTSSTSGANLTWAAPTVTSFFGEALDYATWNNNTKVILQFTNSSGIGNHVSIAVGTLNSAGTIAFTGEQIALPGQKGPSFDLQYIFTGVYLGTASEGFPVLVASEVDAYTHGFSDNAHRTSINATVTFATNAAYTTWSSPLTIISATGVNATGPPNPGGGPPTRWNPTIDTMANGDVYVTAGSATQVGQLGVFGVAFHTGSKTFATVDTIIPKSTNPLNPVTGSGTFNIFPGIDFLPLVEGTASENNQTLGFAIRTGSTWGPLVNPTTRGGYNVNVQDLSQFLTYDPFNHELVLFSQTAGPLGINAAFSDNNGTTWSNRFVVFHTTNPLVGNVSSVFNRNGATQYAVKVTDGTIRFGNFWDEGTGTSPIQANGYTFMFGSYLSPHGVPQPGNNCASASTAITKTGINLQAASGKQLVTFWDWDCVSSGVKAGCLDTVPDFSSVEVILRTNSTLPGFTENYNPLNDSTVRMDWQYIMLNNGEMQSVVYLSHANGKSILNEGLQNDRLLSICNGSGGGNLACNAPTTFASGTTINFGELILNYTGPSLDLAMATEQNGGSVNPSIEVDTTTQGNAQMQQGITYFLMIHVTWGPTLDPAPGEVVDFRTGDQLNTFFGQSSADNIHPTTSSFYSTPNVCDDPSTASKTTCSNSQFTFHLNPLDPSSWANMIVKGIEFIFLVILPPAFLVIIGFLAQALNVIGGFFGFQNFGTTLFALVNQFVLFFTNQFPTAVGNQVAVFARYFDSLTILFAWVPTALAIASYLLTLGINGIGFLLLATQDVFLIWNAMIIMFLFIFWFADTGEYGISGILAWFETMKFFVFGLGIGPLLDAIHYGLQIILLLVGIIPKPFVQMAAQLDQILPKIHVSGNPTWPNFNMDRLRSGDYFSAFGFLLGVTVLVWFETTSLPGSLTALVPGVGISLTRLSSVPNLLLIWMEVFAMIGIFVLPAQLFKSLGADLPGFGNLRFQRGVPLERGKVSAGIGRREPSKILARAQRKISPQKELERLQSLEGEKRAKEDERIRQRELKEVHGKDLKGPEF